MLNLLGTAPGNLKYYGFHFISELSRSAKLKETCIPELHENNWRLDLFFFFFFFFLKITLFFCFSVNNARTINL